MRRGKGSGRLGSPGSQQQQRGLTARGRLFHEPVVPGKQLRFPVDGAPLCLVGRKTRRELALQVGPVQLQHDGVYRAAAGQTDDRALRLVGESRVCNAPPMGVQLRGKSARLRFFGPATVKLILLVEPAAVLLHRCHPVGFFWRRLRGCLLLLPFFLERTEPLFERGQGKLPEATRRLGGLPARFNDQSIASRS